MARVADALRLKLAGIIKTEAATLWNTLFTGFSAVMSERSLWNAPAFRPASQLIVSDALRERGYGQGPGTSALARSAAASVVMISEIRYPLRIS